MKNKITLHALATFDRSAKVRWLLTELGVEFKDIIMENDENNKPEFLKLNPMGRVPVLEYEGVAMFESGAICTYLADKYSEKGLAPGLNSPDRGPYLQWMFFASAMLDTIQTRIMVVEDIPAGELRTKKETALINDLRDATEAISVALSTNNYLVGNKFSAADIAVGYHIYFLMFWPELAEVMREFPNVVSYLNRLKEMPSAVKADVFSYEE